MTTMAEIEAVVKAHTDSDEILAGFYEACAQQAWRGTPSGMLPEEYLRLASDARLRIFKRQLESENFANAAQYAEEHDFRPPGGWTAFATQWVQATIADRPWEALNVARRYNLGDLAHEAARKEGKRILASSGHDVARALEIAKRELHYDTDFRKRAARRAFAQCIVSGNFFCSLPGLVAEFREAFSEAEVAAADFLGRAEKERQDQRSARLRQKS